jgi:hypothetical protein
MEGDLGMLDSLGWPDQGLVGDGLCQSNAHLEAFAATPHSIGSKPWMAGSTDATRYRQAHGDASMTNIQPARPLLYNQLWPM